jgi:hypothetical protein
MLSLSRQRPLEDCVTLAWRVHSVAELFWIQLWPISTEATR